MPVTALARSVALRFRVCTAVVAPTKVKDVPWNPLIVPGTDSLLIRQLLNWAVAAKPVPKPPLGVIRMLAVVDVPIRPLPGLNVMVDPGEGA